MRRAQRRGRVLVRSLLMHVLVLALVGLGLVARMSESSDVQLAAAEHAAALAQLDPAAFAAPLPHSAGAWSPPAPRADLSLPGALPSVSSAFERAASPAPGAHDPRQPAEHLAGSAPAR